LVSSGYRLDEKRSRIVTLLVAISLTVFSLGYINSADGYVLNVFMDRDMWRGANFDWLQTVTGPESNTGSGAPGGFFYGLIHMALLLNWDPVSPEVLRTVLVVASVIAFYIYTFKVFGPIPAALITTLYASSGLMRTVAVFWNPGFMPLFAVLITVTMHAYLRHRKGRDLFLVFLLSALASQIHQQVIFLLVAFLIALAIFRIWCGWRQIAAALCGFMLPFVTFLIKEAHEGFPRFVGMFERLSVSQYIGHDSAFVFADFLKLGLFSRVISSGADPYRGLIGGAVGKFFDFGLHSVDIMIIVVTLGFMAVIVRSVLRSSQITTAPDDICGLALFVLVFLVCAVVTVKGYVIGRHLVVAIPAAAILSGMGIYRFVSWAARGRLAQFRDIALILCVLGGALRCIYFGLFGFTSVAVEAYRYPGMMELTKFFRHTYGWNYEDVEARVASYIFDGTTLVPQRLNIGSFFDILPVNLGQDRPENVCTIILEKKSLKNALKGSPSEFLRGDPLLIRLDPTFVGKRESENFTFFDYTGRGGNCLKGAANPYIDGPLERSGLLKARAYGRPLRKEVRAVKTEYQGRSIQGFSFWNDRSRYPLAILFSEEGPAIIPTMVGREIHGSTGLSARILSTPKIIFESKKDTASEIAMTYIDELGTGALSRGAVGFLAPWRLSPVRLKPGEYRVRFEAGEDGSVVSILLGEVAVSGTESDRAYRLSATDGS
jgi:hypothetical protein